MYIGDLSGQMLLGLAKSQGQLAISTARLSSGLRVNTAADDPSGLAIATGLQSQSMGLDQGQHEIQTAVNAVTVADGALETVTEILQRMRTLVVSGRGAMLSAADRADINAELDALGKEVDRIAQNTNFNGKSLLDGSLSAAPATAGGGVLAYNGRLASGATLIDPAQLVANPTGLPVDLQISVDAYDPTTGLLSVSINAASPNPAQTFNSAMPQSTQILAGQNYDDGYNSLALLLGGTVASLFPNADQYSVADGSGTNIVTFVMNNLSPSDVGTTAFIYTTNPTPPGQGGLNVGLGDHEGDTVTLSMPGVSQADLQIAGTAVSANDVITEGSEYRLDAAMVQVEGARASLGAQSVALQETEGDMATASANLTASESNIRDVNVAAEATAFVREQIQQGIGTRLLASGNHMQTILMELMSASLVG